VALNNPFKVSIGAVARSFYARKSNSIDRTSHFIDLVLSFAEGFSCWCPELVDVEEFWAVVDDRSSTLAQADHLDFTPQKVAFGQRQHFCTL